MQAYENTKEERAPGKKMSGGKEGEGVAGGRQALEDPSGGLVGSGVGGADSPACAGPPSSVPSPLLQAPLAPPPFAPGP